MTVLTIVVVLIVGSFIINNTTNFYIDDFREQMYSVFSEDLILQLRGEAEGEDGAEHLYQTLSAYSTALGIDANRNFYILDGKSGNVLAGTSDDAPELTASVIAAMAGKVGQETRLTDAFLDVAVPISGGENSYIVYLKDTKQELQNINQTIILIIIQAVVFGIIISVLLSLLLSKTMTVPIEKLTAGVGKVAAGDLSLRVDVHSRDEIGKLTDAFNNMAGVLEDSVNRLESERDRLDTMFSHMADGVISMSQSGDILSINPAAERLLGVKQGPGLKYSDLFGESGISLEEAASLDPSKFLERTFSLSGRTLHLYLATYGHTGGERDIMAVLHDITDQDRLEKARREFVSNVSHELRTPLSNIKGYAETLVDATDIDDETRGNFLGVILSETDRMTRIVKDLLTLSRLDYNKMDWQISRFSIQRSLENVCTAMSLSASNSGHELTLDIPVSLPELTGDRERIEQVIVNIISNSIKYTPAGGRIVVRAVTDVTKLNLTVTDNGIGIPAEDIPRLFDRFYRVDKARTRASGGTGLGLAIAREIVEHHRGSISVASEVDKGTTVSIVLPLEDSHEG